MRRLPFRRDGGLFLDKRRKSDEPVYVDIAASACSHALRNCAVISRAICGAVVLRTRR